MSTYIADTNCKILYLAHVQQKRKSRYMYMYMIVDTLKLNIKITEPLINIADLAVSIPAPIDIIH